MSKLSLEMMKYIRIISRIIVGIVFVFSGFVKAVDPLGSAYKFVDYFTAFGAGFMEPLALPLSILLSSVEITMGITLLLAYRMRFFSWLVMIFMSFFTILTFILAIYNPVSDCGCFGDALILTNWQTFWKNIVIQFFVVLILLQRNNYREITNKLTEWTIITFTFLCFILFAVYSFSHLPLVDFRPYSIGTDIPYKMSIPPGAEPDIYETRLIYKNKQSGKEEIFSLYNFPSDSSSYSFVDAESILVKKGFEPSIHDFFISSLNGTDITDFIINDPGFSFLLISHDLSEASKKALSEAEYYAKFAKVSGDASFYCITSSSDQLIGEIKKELDLSYEFYHADEITLKTIVRANPGLVLIKNGTILGKWHYNDFPELGLTGSDFREIIDNYPFSPGADLNNLNVPPPGADTDVYETLLFYKNILTDSISSFTIDNFPDSPEWQFVRSESKITGRGFTSPLSDFKTINVEGTDISRAITSSEGNVFLFMVKDPEKINNELLTRINNLSISAAASDTSGFQFFCVTTLNPEELISFTDKFISPIIFTSGDENMIQHIAVNGIALIWLRNSNVMKIVKDENIPSPSELHDFLTTPSGTLNAEKLILPAYHTCMRLMLEKRIIYIFIFGFFTFSLFLRVFIEKRKSGQ